VRPINLLLILASTLGGLLGLPGLQSAASDEAAVEPGWKEAETLIRAGRLREAATAAAKLASGAAARRWARIRPLISKPPAGWVLVSASPGLAAWPHASARFSRGDLYASVELDEGRDEKWIQEFLWQLDNPEKLAKEDRIVRHAGRRFVLMGAAHRLHGTVGRQAQGAYVAVTGSVSGDVLEGAFLAQLDLDAIERVLADQAPEVEVSPRTQASLLIREGEEKARASRFRAAYRQAVALLEWITIRRDRLVLDALPQTLAGGPRVKRSVGSRRSLEAGWSYRTKAGAYLRLVLRDPSGTKGSNGPEATIKDPMRLLPSQRIVKVRERLGLLTEDARPNSQPDLSLVLPLLEGGPLLEISTRDMAEERLLGRIVGELDLIPLAAAASK